MVARINPHRALTAAEKAKRHRDNHAEYVRSLEAALSDATWMPPGKWSAAHGPTIRRAVQSQTKDR